MREKEEAGIQESFLTRLKDVLPGDGSLAHELSEVLEISMDSAYRRIRGETPLTLEEAHVLSKRFNVSFDALNSNSPGVVHFAYTPTTAQFESMFGYLTRLRENLKMIKARENKHILYCSQDIPIFHNVGMGKVSEFKLFYWMRSILNIEELLSVQFSEKWIPIEMKELCKDIYELYSEIPSSELWSRSTINSTLRQIQYYWESGLFANAAAALEVTEGLRQLLHLIEKQAASGYKSDNAEANEYNLYISEIELTTNCAIVEMDDNKAVFLGHLTFNMLQSTQKSYCDQTAFWFKNMVSKATLISNVGEKYRFQFFKDAQKSINALESIIQSSGV